MAVTYEKKSKKTKMAVPDNSAALVELIDLAGEQKAIVDDLKAKLKLAEDDFKETRSKLKEEIIPSSASADAEFTEVGNKFHVKFGKKGKSRYLVDGGVKRVMEIMGDAFWGVASVPLGKLDDYLTPDERDEVLEYHQDGARSLKITEID